jgi:hypothetical protein
MAALSVSSRRLPGMTQRKFFPSRLFRAADTTAHRTATSRDVPGSSRRLARSKENLRRASKKAVCLGSRTGVSDLSRPVRRRAGLLRSTSYGAPAKTKPRQSQATAGLTKEEGFKGLSLRGCRVYRAAVAEISPGFQPWVPVLGYWRVDSTSRA